LTAVIAELGVSAGTAALARAILPLASHLEVRRADSAAHQDALASARIALRSSPVYLQVQYEVGSEHAEAATILLFAIAERLTPNQRDELGALNGTITEELSNLRAQFAALLSIEDLVTNI